ncbi:Phage Tail Collar Domain protein [compost metagenome]
MRYPDGRPGHRYLPAQPGTETMWQYCIALEGVFPSPSDGNSNVFLGQLAIFPYSFTPGDHTECAGMLLPISTNTALFSLLGTEFGGDGKSNFALPDTRWDIANAYHNVHRGFEETHLHYTIARQGIFPQRP